ncbi:MAG: zinc ribbon domain-containing protein [Acidimicrobiales bacterium]
MADPDLAILLEIQAHDVALMQLEEKRRRLPTRATLVRTESRVISMRAKIDERTAVQVDIRVRQRAAEAGLVAAEGRLAAIERKMASGQVPARELAAMTRELQSLRRQKDELEDATLQSMEEADALDADIVRLRADQREIELQVIELAEDLDVVEDEFARREAEHTRERLELAGKVPRGLMDHYETLRDRLGGVGVARLEAGRCTGCHLTLPIAEIDAAHRAAPGSLVHCEQCGRILVP